MSTFVINGGKSLSGSIAPQGAKNEALQVICAALLTPEKVGYSEYSEHSGCEQADQTTGGFGCEGGKNWTK